MPFVKRDSKKENKMLQDLISASSEAKQEHEEFEANYQSRKSLINKEKKGRRK